MSMTDPLADLLTRIRNANRIGRTTVDCPASNLKRGTLGVLKREGFIRDFRLITEEMTVDNNMLTPKMSMKRRNVIAAYQHLLDEMYR